MYLQYNNSFENLIDAIDTEENVVNINKIHLRKFSINKSHSMIHPNEILKLNQSIEI